MDKNPRSKHKSDIPDPTMRSPRRCDWCDAGIPHIGRLLAGRNADSVIYVGEPYDFPYYFCNDRCARKFVDHAKATCPNPKVIKKWADVKGR